MTDLKAIKSNFRGVAKQALNGLSPHDARRASDMIQARVLAQPEYVAAEAIFLYMAFGNEISTEAILDRSRLDAKRIFLPAFADGEYWVTEYLNGEQLVEGHYGILEPERKAEPQLPERMLVILPGLAFDRQCHRLGRGGGYYDRILQRLSQAGIDLVNMGLTYDCTLYEELPVGPLDFDVDIVVTEKESVRNVGPTCSTTE